MLTPCRTSLRWLLALGLTLCAMLPAAHAVTDLTPSPATRAVAVARSASVAITWRMNTQANPPALVRSEQGRFVAGGVELGTVPVRLTQRVTGQSGSAVSIGETLRVPAAVLRRALQLGANQVLFERTFTDGTPATASLRLDLAGGLGAGFDLTRVELHFDDDSVIRTVTAGDSLHPLARISYSGSGTLVVTWEIATPDSTGGQALFRPLANVRRFLSAGREALLRGPGLPTGRPGLYLLRLRIDAPAVEGDAPLLRYHVINVSSGVTDAPAASMGLVAPDAGAPVDASTRFEWATHPQARAYRLELYSETAAVQPGVADRATEPALASETLTASPRADGRPVTGMLLPGNTTSAVLSLPVRARLARHSDRAFLWRVVAIGVGGDALASTELRRFLVRF